MPIFRAFGFGILLVILSLMLPAVLTEIEKTAIVFLQGAQASALVATDLIESASTSSAGTTPSRLTLPHAPYPSY